jgi:hypothetical protein
MIIEDDTHITWTFPIEHESVDKEQIKKVKNKVCSLFENAGFEVKSIYELVNEYWPNTYRYWYVRALNPWWLVETQYGKILYAPRKRVVSIDWSETKFRGIISEDDTTKGDTFIHSWVDKSTEKYLKELFNCLS